MLNTGSKKIQSDKIKWNRQKGIGGVGQTAEAATTTVAARHIKANGRKKFFAKKPAHTHTQNVT